MRPEIKIKNAVELINKKLGASSIYARIREGALASVNVNGKVWRDTRKRPMLYSISALPGMNEATL